MERNVIRVFGYLPVLTFLEQLVIVNGVVDGSRCQHRIEPPGIGGRIVLVEDRIHDGLPRNEFVRSGVLRSFAFEIVDMKFQNVPIINGVGDGIGV